MTSAAVALEFPDDELRRLRIEVNALTARAESAEAMSDELLTQRDQLTAKLTAAWRRADLLQKQLDEEQGISGDLEPEVRQVWEWWKQRVRPRARNCKSERARPIRARLNEGHSVNDLLQAVEGTYWRPTVDPVTKVKRDELELSMRSEANVHDRRQRFRNVIAEERLWLLLLAYCTPQGRTAKRDDLEQIKPQHSTEGHWAFKCPVCRTRWAEDFLCLRAGREKKGPFFYCMALDCSRDLSEQQIREALMEAPFAA